FQDEENVYLVMRMYDQTLTRAIYSRTLRAQQIKVFAVELLLGLEALHCMGIVHRDMKPDNLLITPNGHLAIADFGLARMFTELPTMRMYEQCGTTGYMPPEVISDQVQAQGYTSSADIWGYGMIIYEMLIGRRALDADALEEQEILNMTLSTVIHGDIDRHVGEADALAADLLHQLLEPEGAKRPSWPAIKKHAWF
ncbi:kinase-like protein, partial [Athelia psychrophila]